MKQKLQEQKSKEFTFRKHCVKKRENQYYAMIRMGGFVLPTQKSEGVLSEGVLSAHQNEQTAHDVKVNFQYKYWI